MTEVSPSENAQRLFLAKEIVSLVFNAKHERGLTE